MNQKRNNDELLTTVFGSKEVLEPAPTDVIPQGMMRPEIAYQIVKDETYPQTQPRLNLATFVTTYMDEYATRLMNEAISVNYIDETEYPRIAVMNGRCINMIANLWNTPEKAQWKAGALGIGSSEACMLGGVAAWLRWRKRRQAAGKPFDKPNLVMSAGFQVVWEKFCQLWQIELRTVPLTLKNPTLDPEQALAMCDENTICIVPIQGVTWTGLNDDVEALDKALDAYNKKTGFEIPIHVDAASGGFILPFLNPEVKWDFRLKWVLSISTSGHKYGLVYPGLGWVVWKDKKYLPDEMSFSVNYLGANITQVGLNFSRPAAQVLGQYYNFLRLGFEGYKEIQQNSMDIATYCHDQIGKMKCFRNYADKLVNPLFIWYMNPDYDKKAKWTLYDLQALLQQSGWMVPAYTMPENLENLVVMRVVVRQGTSRDMIDMLIDDIKNAVAELEKLEYPTDSRIVMFFGKYKGTFYETGFWWINPFMGRKKISVRARNLNVEPIKVNDKNGNPVMIGLVLVWKICPDEIYRAVFDIDASTMGGTDLAVSASARMKVLENFVSVQSDAALRQVAGYYAYDNNGVADDELTLRSNSDEINDQLEAKLNDRLSMAGIEVIEARINYLAYAPEIAAVMLRRQQADAIISAREKIVEGAVTMVKMALDRLADDRIVELDEERKAAMVSNLLVVLCADEAAQPIVNAGTLHH